MLAKLEVSAIRGRSPARDSSSGMEAYENGEDRPWSSGRPTGQYVFRLEARQCRRKKWEGGLWLGSVRRLTGPLRVPVHASDGCRTIWSLQLPVPPFFTTPTSIRDIKSAHTPTCTYVVSLVLRWHGGGGQWWSCGAHRTGRQVV